MASLARLDAKAVSDIDSAWQIYLKHSGKDAPFPAADASKKTVSSRDAELAWSLQTLSSHGMGKFVAEHFLQTLEEEFKEKHAPKFWQHFNGVANIPKEATASMKGLRNSRWGAWVDSSLKASLAEVCASKALQQQRLAELARLLQSNSTQSSQQGGRRASNVESLIARHDTATSAILLTSAPSQFPDVLRWFYGLRLQEFSRAVSQRVKAGGQEDRPGISMASGSSEGPEPGPEASSRCRISASDSPAASSPDVPIGGHMSAGGSAKRSFPAIEDSDIGRPVMDEDGSDIDGESPLDRRRWRRRSSSVSQMSGIERSEGGGVGDEEEDEAEDMEGIDYGGCLSMEGAGTVVGLTESAKVVGEDWVSEVATVARQLRQLGLGPMSEEAYSSVIYNHLKNKIAAVAGGKYERPLLGPIRRWIGGPPLLFCCIVLPNPPPTSAQPSLYGGHSLASLSASPCPPQTPSSSFKQPPPSVAENTSEAVVRWRLRLEFFAYETLGDLRISELFDIIVDYPESLPAVEDLRHCLQHTSTHARLVESFQVALQRRLLSAGAATTDILHHYVATIKSLRVLDPSGVILEAVGEPIKEYLRGRKDTIRCVVSMLTDDSSGPGSNAGGAESLFDELGRTQSLLEDEESDEEEGQDDEAALIAAQGWEPDPVEADPSKVSRTRRNMDIISMLVGIYGSKELFVNEYRTMLADKLLSKSDYDTERDIRTVELLKLRFGESNMHNCEVMLKDITDSKRINTNIKRQISSQPSSPRPTSPAAAAAAAAIAAATSSVAMAAPSLPPALPQPIAPAADIDNRLAQLRSRVRALRTASVSLDQALAMGPTTPTARSPMRIEEPVSLDVLDATIVSSLFWPPLQGESLKVPPQVERMLEFYAQKYFANKTPRKLQWKNHLGTVKLELSFEDRSAQFVVSPVHASIIMLFEERSSWPARELAEAVGLTVSTLCRKILLWVNQGVVVESSSSGGGETVYTVVERLSHGGRGAVPLGAAGSSGEGSGMPLLAEEEPDSAVISMEDQWEQEMAVYETYVMNMLTNMDALPLDKIHNMLKMYVVEPAYDKTLQQLQAFLGKLVSEEKLEIRDGLYHQKG